MNEETHQQKRDRLGQHVCLKCGGLASRWHVRGSSERIYKCKKCFNEWLRIPPKKKNKVKELQKRCEELADQYQNEAELRLAAESDVWSLENYVMTLNFHCECGLCLPCRIRKKRTKNNDKN